MHRLLPRLLPKDEAAASRMRFIEALQHVPPASVAPQLLSQRLVLHLTETHHHSLLENGHAGPRFNESFVNYAYDKVAWFEELRYIGYRFDVLTDGYSVDIPHPE